jgi:oxygen-independent coproporphyrinogen-3 oxidase
VSATPDQGAVRFASPDSLEQYIAEAPFERNEVSRQAALEESFFLGLRLTRGLDLGELSADFGEEALGDFENEVSEFLKSGLMEIDGRYVRLTPQGRLLSNEVFQRFLSPLKPAEVVRATMM